MNESNNQGEQKISISDSQMAGVSFGGQAEASHFSQALGTGAILHPQADRVKQKLVELKNELEKSDIPDFKKRDALNSLKELEKELEKEESSVRQEGIRYYLAKFLDIAKGAKPLIDLVGSLAKLLGVSI